MGRQLYCNECGRKLSWESCIPATWMGKRVCLCKECAYSVSPGLAPRLNPRKCYQCGREPAKNKWGGHYWCDKCWRRIQWQFGGPTSAAPTRVGKRGIRLDKNPLTPEVCKFCGAKLYGPYWGKMQVCPRCGKRQYARNPKKSYKLVATFPSKSRPDKSYEVKVDEAGNLSCSCPAWRFKKAGKERTCKHVQAVLAGRSKNPKTRLIVTRCRRCGRPLSVSPRALASPYGGICSRCITPTEERDILEEQAQTILKKKRGRRGRNPVSLYQKFHGNPPARRRKVNVPIPKKDTMLTVLGRMPEIRYTPYNPSQYAGTTFRHKFGDTGRVMLPGKPLLATDGKDFYVIKDGKSRAKFTERGIIG